MANIIAIATYGSQRVKPPFSKTRVSAYKIGYTNAGRAVLLALLNDQARVVSPLQARYHYIQIDVDVTVRHGYLILNVTDDELAQTEALTLQVTYPAIYRWHNGTWHEFPTRDNPEYHLPPDRRGPSFNPDSLRISTTGGDKESATPDTITAEQVNGWWWLQGDTYPHRETLKQWDCRWSKKRRAWYYIGQDLPEAVEALLTPQDDAPCSDEEVEAILGVPLKLQPKPETPALFAVDDTVYTRHELSTSDDVTIPTGAKGIVTKIYNRNPTHGWSYDVQFDEIGTGWFVEDELTSLEMPANIRITRGEIIPTDDAPTEEIPHIRIIKPDTSDDVITTAIHQTKDQPLSIATSIRNSKRQLVTISQTPCGELTGSITGNVWCYGWAVYEGICIYLNMGGPRMAVEAIRAKLAKGDLVSCVPYDAPSVELTAGEGNTGMYTSFIQNIPEAKFTSMILLHDQVTQPNYGGKSTTFILHGSDEQAIAQLHNHVTKLVKVPVFPEWTGYLWQAGQSAMLVRKTRGAGGLDVLAVVLDVDAWTRLITGGLSQGIIALPPVNNPSPL